MIVFSNHEFVDEAAAHLPLSDLGLQRGYAVFDFFRTRDFIPLFMDDYLERFFNSAGFLSLPIPYTADELKDIIATLIQKNGIPNAGVRLLLTGGASMDGYRPATPNFIITLKPVQLTTPEQFATGIKVITHEHRRELPLIKSINYLTAVWLQPKIKASGAEDVLYHGSSGISEFPRSNVFMVTNDNQLVTPKHHLLRGITRKQVMGIAAKRLTVTERDITLDELWQAREVFMTSTTKRLLPVVKIDDHPVGDGKPGKITRQLMADFMALEESFCKRPSAGLLF